MPIPEPKSGEEKNDFISRCMGDDNMVDEYEQDQRAAICYKQWERKNEDYIRGSRKMEELDFRSLVETAKSTLYEKKDSEDEEVDAKKLIKDLAKAYGSSNEDQGQMVQMLKGLAFSDDPAANTFMKALDKWTTAYAKKLNEDKDELEESYFSSSEMKNVASMITNLIEDERDSLYRTGKAFMTELDDNMTEFNDDELIGFYSGIRHRINKII